MLKFLIIMAIVGNILGFLFNLDLVIKINKRGYKRKNKEGVTECIIGWIKHIVMFGFPFVNIIIVLVFLFISSDVLIESGLEKGIIIDPNN